MVQQRLLDRNRLADNKKEVRLSRPYSLGPYNLVRESDQIIRLTEGCPNGCLYCGEPGPPYKLFPIPKIIRNSVQILDMNLLAKPQALEYIKRLGSLRANNKIIYYELVCGIDFRFLTPEIAQALHDNHFINIRLAWDYGLEDQKRIKSALKILTDSGYRSEDLMIFIICNWRTTHIINANKVKVYPDRVFFDSSCQGHEYPIGSKIFVYGPNEMEAADQIAFRVQSGQNMEQLINFYERMSYAEPLLAGQFAKLDKISDLNKKKQDRQKESMYEDI